MSKSKKKQKNQTPQGGHDNKYRGKVGEKQQDKIKGRRPKNSSLRDTKKYGEKTADDDLYETLNFVGTRKTIPRWSGRIIKYEAHARSPDTMVVSASHETGNLYPGYEVQFRSSHMSKRFCSLDYLEACDLPDAFKYSQITVLTELQELGGLFAKMKRKHND